MKNPFVNIQKAVVIGLVEGPAGLYSKLVQKWSGRTNLTYLDWIEKFERSKKVDLAEIKTQSNLEVVEIKDQNLSFEQLINKSKAEFLILVFPGYKLSERAVSEIAQFVKKNSEFDLIYTDEDKIDSSGHREDPLFKPDYSPEFLESFNYIGETLIVRRTLLEKLKLVNTKVSNTDSYELLLEISEATTKIGHIPKVIFHQEDSGKPKTQAKKLLEDHFKRLNESVSILGTDYPGVFEIKKQIESDTVTIIICSAGNLSLATNCLDSIFSKTTYKNYQVLLLDNSGNLEFQKKLSQRYGQKLSIQRNWDKPFNFAKLNNSAAKKANSDFLLFLNDDTKILTDDWIENLLNFGQKNGVGVVGAKLLYPNNTVQHAGVIVGYKGRAGHGFVGKSETDPGYLNRLVSVQNYSAVTGACFLIRAELFREVGGFDETLAVAFNDVDLCLKVISKGYRVVWTPFAKLIHYESFTRGWDLSISSRKRLVSEEKYFVKKWQVYIDRGDPYYSPNLSLDENTFELRRP